MPKKLPAEFKRDVLVSIARRGELTQAPRSSPTLGSPRRPCDAGCGRRSSVGRHRPVRQLHSVMACLLQEQGPQGTQCSPLRVESEDFGATPLHDGRTEPPLSGSSVRVRGLAILVQGATCLVEARPRPVEHIHGTFSSVRVPCGVRPAPRRVDPQETRGRVICR